MFGSIKPIKEELKVREYEIFRAYYCGLCKRIGKKHSNIARLGLNYDFTFLAMLIDATFKGEDELKKARCLLHPLENKNIIINQNSLNYVSDLGIILTSEKLKDDWKDERDFKGLLGYKFYSRITRNIELEYKDSIKIFSDELNKLAKLESDKTESVDACAQPFAEIMKKLFSPIWIDEKNSRILGQIGYDIGQWIYMVDAIEDIKKDFKKGLFNPFLNKEKPTAENIDQVIKKVKFEMEDTLFFILGKIADSYELLEIHKNKGILDNIIYLGIRAKTEHIIDVRKGDNYAKSI